MKLFDLFGVEKLVLKIKNLGINIGKNNRIGDTKIFRTKLTNKNRKDVRKLKIVRISNELKVIAIYVDGEEDKNFEGYWHGWQIAPNSLRGMIWTPLGKHNQINMPSNFTEISVWVNEQSDKENIEHNVHSSIAVDM